MKAKIGLAILMLIASITIPAMASTLTAYLQVLTPTCGLNTSTSAINFGSVLAGNNTTIQGLSVSITGTFYNASAYIRGTDWVSGGNSFSVNNTLWCIEDFFNYGACYADDIGPKVFLQSSDVLFNWTTIPVYNNFEFKIMTPSLQTAGSYNQNITLTIEC